MLQFSLLIWTFPLQGISGCKTYLTRSEQDGARVARIGRRAGKIFEGRMCFVSNWWYLVVTGFWLGAKNALCGYPLLKFPVENFFPSPSFSYFRQIIWGLSSAQFHF